jgi:hypothetical protein
VGAALKEELSEAAEYITRTFAFFIIVFMLPWILCGFRYALTWLALAVACTALQAGMIAVALPIAFAWRKYDERRKEN